MMIRHYHLVALRVVVVLYIQMLYIYRERERALAYKIVSCNVDESGFIECCNAESLFRYLVALLPVLILKVRNIGYKKFAVLSRCPSLWLCLF
jgi:hypothetical protein